MKKLYEKKLSSLLAAVLLALGITAGVTAAFNGEKKAGGGYSSPIADRIDIKVDKTNFTLKKNDSGTDKYTVSFVFSIKKTQPDFYAVINSLEIKGENVENTVFAALNKATEKKIPPNLNLPAENGKCLLIKWQIDLNLISDSPAVCHPSIELDYTSGMTEGSADRKHLSIPLSVTIE